MSERDRPFGGGEKERHLKSRAGYGCFWHARLRSLLQADKNSEPAQTKRQKCGALNQDKTQEAESNFYQIAAVASSILLKEEILFEYIRGAKYCFLSGNK